MKIQYLLNILFFVLILKITNCIAKDNYLLVIQLNYDNCIMLLYQNNNNYELDKKNIVAKTYCALLNSLEQDNSSLKYNIFFKYSQPLIKLCLQNLKEQLVAIRKSYIHYIPVENAVVSFYNNVHATAVTEVKIDYTNDKVFFINILKQLLIKHRFFINRKIIVVKNNELLTQAALEYFYNTEIDKSKVDKLLVSSINIEPENIEVITNKATQKNMSFNNIINTSEHSDKTKDRSIFYTMFEDGFFDFKQSFSHKSMTLYSEKFVIMNYSISQYKIYKLSIDGYLNNLITNEYLEYNKINDKNYLKNNYDVNYNKIIKIVTQDINAINDIFLKNKMDYVILIGNALSNNIIGNSYFQQLEKIYPNIASDRIYIVNNEEFYLYLVGAARTILLQYNDNKNNNTIEDNFKPSVWEYSANKDNSVTNSVKIDQDMVKKMSVFINENETNNTDYSYIDHDYNYGDNTETDTNDKDHLYVPQTDAIQDDTNTFLIEDV